MSLHTAVEKIIINYFDKAPYLKHPGAMYARVTKAVQIDEKTWEYSIKLITEQLGINTEYPEIPCIKSAVKAENGSIVAVVLMYGQIKPYIIGEVF